jgi:23S rRNA (adenine-N6)-dimethyltransferase
LKLQYTQNFLRDKALVERLVSAARIQPGSTVLEIGSGKGIITAALAKAAGAAGRVIAVELDEKLAENLRALFQNTPQVEILHMDILQFKLEALPENYSVFSNIPFSITSTLLEFLLNPKTGPRSAHLILQKDALIDPQGEPFKAFLMKPLYEITTAHTFRRSDFVPQPGVDTALFGFTKRAEPLVNPVQYDLYKDFLAFVSKDRVGEGVWTRVFSKGQIAKTALIVGRGLKAQTVNAMTDAFKQFAASNRTEVVKGAMARLRAEQQRREQINQAGGHRRPR